MSLYPTPLLTTKRLAAFMFLLAHLHRLMNSDDDDF
jgi:hypothetical protein